MYLRAIHAESNIPLLQQFIRDNPLGILTTAIKSPLYPFLQSSHIPFILDVPDITTPGISTENENENEAVEQKPLGILRGHIAKQNPQAKALIDLASTLTNNNNKEASLNPTPELPDEVLILFNGPCHHYVTPKFYKETKPDTGKVVPTWNYAAVQAYGKIRIYADSRDERTNAFLQRQVEDLSSFAEREIMGYTGTGAVTDAGEKPWAVSDAPSSYVEILKRNIVGMEVRIERLQGKWKMSQEMKEGDREGVVEGFEKLGSDVGREIARTVRERAELIRQ